MPPSSASSRVQAAYKWMLVCDQQHMVQRDETTHQRVMRAQRKYHVLLTQVNKARYAEAPLELMRLRARHAWERATQNKRTAITQTHTEIADHQWHRAMRILRRANNMLEIEREHYLDLKIQQEDQKRIRKQEAQNKLVATIHPLTRRRVRVTREQAQRWKQQ